MHDTPVAISKDPYWVENDGVEPGSLPMIIDVLWCDGSSDAGYPSEHFGWSFPPDGYTRAGCFIRAWRQAGRYHYVYYADDMRVLDGEITADETIVALERFERDSAAIPKSQS